MNQIGFEHYTRLAYGDKTGTANSYIQAVHIIDRIFSIEDVFGLNGKKLTEINDPHLLQNIAEFVSSEEKKFKSGHESIFRYGSANQTSYPRKGFCSAAIKHLQRYLIYESQRSTADEIAGRLNDGKTVSKELLKKLPKHLMLKYVA